MKSICIVIILVFSFVRAEFVENKFYKSIYNNDVTSSNIDNNLVLTFNNKIENSVNKIKIIKLSQVFKKNINKLKVKYKKLDVVFLIDSSSSVGKVNFQSEIKFVQKLLSDLNVSYNNTRVSVITFGSQEKIIRHVDQISAPSEENDKCKLLNYGMPKIEFNGGGTYTYGALEKAKETLANGRTDSKKIIFLVTDGFSNGKDPIGIAKELKDESVTIFTFGIQTGNYAELYNISSFPSEEHNFLLDSFSQFESLARKALHSDYKFGNYVRVSNQSICSILCEDKIDKPSSTLDADLSCCDKNSECVCGTSSGHYSCMCMPGYYGSGFKNGCELCPNGTYWQSENLCRPCPDLNHITLKTPAVNINDCVCKTGFKTSSNNRCQIITCPELKPPDNGYFVKHPVGCGRVLNAACGARCKSGYQLSGSSIRLCQENGTWSGVEAKCVLKTCPSIPIPYYGMAICNNADLNMEYDYSMRNATFVDAYENEILRVTEPMPIDTDCNFKCGPGFYLVGSANRNCLPLSKWDGLQTACKQILCSSLPKIPFGEYDPTDCDHQKHAFGSNCTLTCLSGFEIKGPPLKHCSGKRNGIWTNKSKVPKCIDVTPPILSCPENYTVPMDEFENYANIKQLRNPNVTDNSNLNVTYWSKPAFKDDGLQLLNGTHLFSYIAIDSFKNKAQCNFTITVIDSTPPFIDNCIDPAEFSINLSLGADISSNFIEWEDPVIYDNSNGNINVIQSLYPGYLGIGIHKVEYIAIDENNNTNSCLLNITVTEMKCKDLPSPKNGQTICAQNNTHMWCEVSCNIGHAIYFENEEDYVETLKLSCDHNDAKWDYEFIPDCSTINLPNSIDEIISMSLDSSIPICNTELENELKESMFNHFCGNQSRDSCEIIPNNFVCDDSNSENSSEFNKTFYNIVKRDTLQLPKKSNRKIRSQLKINIYTKVSKDMGYWNSTLTKAENVKQIKHELWNIDRNEGLKKKLYDLNIEIHLLKTDVKLNCKDGSVFKKQICLQCPAGTYHNKTMNMCQPCSIGSYNSLAGQTQCSKCPQNHSTKKSYSRSIDNCREQCRPGSIARVKQQRKNKNSFKITKSLMPFCKKCNPGEYQPFYDGTKCLKCPTGYSSPRGSSSLQNCVPKQNKLCQQDPLICSRNGECVHEARTPYLYSCTCKDGFIGSHCEKQLDLCMSAPCLNGGICSSLNGAVICLCPKNFEGEFCELNFDPCNQIVCENNGECIETNGTATCECEHGFTGVYCGIPVNHCTLSPCVNGACVSTASGFRCICDPGYIGRRCHLRPCDYFPCSNNSNCIDLVEAHASRKSYVCKCPMGWKGANCKDVDNPCHKNPCMNNGQCEPKVLRDLTNATLDELIYGNNDVEDKYSKYICICPPYFYGNHCHIFVTPDYVLSFEKPGINDYAKINGPVVNLNEISFCVWLQTSDTFNYGVILSYASLTSDNMFTFTDYNGFVLYVDGNHIITDITINDGTWHFVCVTWISANGFYEIYLDGKLHDTGYNLSSNSFIEANGSFIIGQEQDTLGSDFSETEAYIGTIAYLDIWNYTISAQTVQEYFMSCEPYFGNLVAWSEFKLNIHGNIKVLSSPFCKPCPKVPTIENGNVVLNDNFAIYTCNRGYVLEGHASRVCLRMSQWENPEPFCRSVICGLISAPLNGYIDRAKTINGEEAVFSCFDDYVLVGSSKISCLSNGTWSGPRPECVSLTHCDTIKLNNSEIIYATEKGPLNQTLSKYPAGTFAEILCVNETVLTGESILFCMENGNWDTPQPTCEPQIIIEPLNKTTNLKTDDKLEQTTSKVELNIETTPTNTNNSDSTNIEFWQIIVSQLNVMNYSIDANFLQSLREFYFYGCSTSDSPTVSIFCTNSNSSHNYTDLTDFNTPDSLEFYDIDEKWLVLLEDAVYYILMNKVNTKHYPKTENLFDYLLYNQNNTKYSTIIENTYRLNFCFYIDSMILQNRFKSVEMLDYTNMEKIQLSLKFFIFPLHAEYLLKKEANVLVNYDLHSELVTEIPILVEKTTVPVIKTVIQCNSLHFISDWNNFMVNFTSSNGIMNIKDESNIKEPTLYNVGDILSFSCKSGYIFKGIPISVCLDSGFWSNVDVKCEEIVCGNPPKTTSIVIENNNKTQKIGTKLKLKCKSGYNINGNSIIECLSTGKWSRIFARCSKISCNKPKIPSNAEIASGRSYLFQDKLQIRCNAVETEIQCGSDGSWFPSIKC